MGSLDKSGAHYALAEGGTIEAGLKKMFRGDYYGSLKDKFGVQWMLNCTEKR
jgi:PhnB protein